MLHDYSSKLPKNRDLFRKYLWWCPYSSNIQMPQCFLLFVYCFWNYGEMVVLVVFCSTRKPFVEWKLTASASTFWKAVYEQTSYRIFYVFGFQIMVVSMISQSTTSKNGCFEKKYSRQNKIWILENKSCLKNVKIFRVEWHI